MTITLSESTNISQLRMSPSHDANSCPSWLLKCDNLHEQETNRPCESQVTVYSLCCRHNSSENQTSAWPQLLFLRAAPESSVTSHWNTDTGEGSFMLFVRGRLRIKEHAYSMQWNWLCSANQHILCAGIKMSRQKNIWFNMLWMSTGCRLHSAYSFLTLTHPS